MELNVDKEEEMAQSESACQNDSDDDNIDNDEAPKIKSEVKEEVDSDQESLGFPFYDDQPEVLDEKRVEQKINAIRISIEILKNEDGQQRPGEGNMKVTKTNDQNKKSYQKLKENPERYARLAAKRKRRGTSFKMNSEDDFSCNPDEVQMKVPIKSGRHDANKKIKNKYKKFYEKLKGDPEKYAAMLAAKREYYRKRGIVLRKRRSLKRNCNEEESCIAGEEVKMEVTRQQRKSAKEKNSYQKLKKDSDKYAATLAANRENYRRRKKRRLLTKKANSDEEPSCDDDETNASSQRKIEIETDMKKTFEKQLRNFRAREKYREGKQTRLEKLNAMTDSERELFISEKRQRMALRKIERLANMTEEKREEQRQKNILRYYEKRATMTAEELEESRRKSREFVKRRRELGKKTKNLPYRVIAQRQTAEQRQKSLRQYRINSAKQLIKRELMTKGVPPEEIQEKLAERLKEFESKLNQKNVPAKPYKPKGGRLFKIIKTSDDDFTIKFLGSQKSHLYNARCFLRKKLRLEGMSDEDIEKKLEEMVNDYKKSNPDPFKISLKPRGINQHHIGETPEQRTYRLKRMSIASKRCQLRKKLEKEGNLTLEEMQEKLENLLKEWMESNPKFGGSNLNGERNRKQKISLKAPRINQHHIGETPEQRTYRLKRLSIYVKRRQLRKKLEKEGNLTSEEMQEKLDNLLKEWVESNPKFRGSSNNISFKEERKRKPKESGSLEIGHHVNFYHAPSSTRNDMTPMAWETAHYPTAATSIRASYSSCSLAIEIEDVAVEEASASVSISSPFHSYSGDYYSGQNEDYNDDVMNDNDPVSPPSPPPTFQVLKTKERQTQYYSSSFHEVLFQSEMYRNHNPAPPPSSASIPPVSTGNKKSVPKRGRGRPKKVVIKVSEQKKEPTKRGRGRPRKVINKMEIS